MSRVKFLKKLSIKDDIETGRKGTKKAGRKNRTKAFRALRKQFNRMLNKQSEE